MREGTVQFEYAVWHAKFRPGPRPNATRTMFRYFKISLLLAYQALVFKESKLSALRVSALFNKLYPDEEQCAMCIASKWSGAP